MFCVQLFVFLLLDCYTTLKIQWTTDRFSFPSSQFSHTCLNSHFKNFLQAGWLTSVHFGQLLDPVFFFFHTTNPYERLPERLSKVLLMQVLSHRRLQAGKEICLPYFNLDVWFVPWYKYHQSWVEKKMHWSKLNQSKKINLSSNRKKASITGYDVFLLVAVTRAVLWDS